MQDLDKFKNEMNLSGKNVYVGHRYVPKLNGEWDNTQIYEPLSIVQYQGNSFTSRQYVPVGIEITNEDYWDSTGNYNAQIEQYRQDVATLNETVKGHITDLNNIGDNLEKVTGKVKNMTRVNVKDFGAKGDSLTDDTAAIQSAIDYFETFAFGSRPVIYFPNGIYLVSQPLIFNYTPIIKGDGMNQSIVRAKVEIPYIFQKDVESTRFGGAKISDIQLDGNDLAGVGLQINEADHSVFFNLKIQKTLKTGVVLNGWCNDLISCQISENKGDGVELVGTANNAINFTNTKVFANDGIGFILQNGNVITFHGSTIENNKKCGIFVKGNIKNLDITGNYFEANGAVTGITISNELIKTDVLINGNLTHPYTYGYSDMNHQIVIKNNNHYNYAENCYTIISVDGIEIDKNYMRWVGNLIRYIENNNYAEIKNLKVGYNYVGANPNYVNNEFSVRRTLGHRQQYHTWKLNDTIEFDTSKIISHPNSSPTGNVTSVEIDSETTVTYLGKKTFKVTASSSGNLNTYGVTLNMDDYPELKGRNFYYTMNYKSSNIDVTPRMFVSGEAATINTYKPTSTKWQTESHGSVFPTSGEVTLGLFIQNVKAGDVIYMTYPEITVFNKKIDIVS